MVDTVPGLKSKGQFLSWHVDYRGFITDVEVWMFLQIIKQQDVGLRKINITKETNIHPA